MKNTILPANEVEKVKAVFPLINEVIETHNQSKPNITMESLDDSGRLERVHTLLYMDLLRDLISTAKALEGMLEMSEEEFVDLITNEGKMTVEEAEFKIMFKAMVDMHS